ncbi:MAG: hypothetical protein O3A21_06605 [Proteobacteria bacterium]|nr:hypothetical protein [Pseudomonadota bacterium]
MRKLASLIIVALIGITAVGLTPTSAHAALMWEFGFIDRIDNFEGTGSFTLGGPNTADGLVAFEFTGVCGQGRLDSGEVFDNDCTFGLADVAEFSWSLTDDWTFDEITFAAGRGFGLLFSGSITATSDALQLVCIGFTAQCNGLNFLSRGQSFETGGAFLTPIHAAIPLPPTLVLYVLGLLAWAWSVSLTRRRPRRFV